MLFCLTPKPTRPTLVLATGPPRALSYAVAPRSNLLHPECIDVGELIVATKQIKINYIYITYHTPRAGTTCPYRTSTSSPSLSSAATSSRVGSKARSLVSPSANFFGFSILPPSRRSRATVSQVRRSASPRPPVGPNRRVIALLPPLKPPILLHEQGFGHQRRKARPVPRRTIERPTTHRPEATGAA